MSRDSKRKLSIRELADRYAAEREQWIDRNSFYYEEDGRYMSFLVPPGLRVLDLGCGTGRLLDSLKPSVGTGVDFSVKMVEEARRRYPNQTFVVGDIDDPELLDSLEGPFDVIVLSDTVGVLEDCQATLQNLRRICHRDTRLVIAYYSRLWAPVLTIAKLLRQQMPQRELNWLSTRDLANIMHLSGFETVRMECRQILPKKLGGLGRFANRYIGILPGIQRLGLRSYVVARLAPEPLDTAKSTTVLIPCRNESGNIAPAIKRIPRFCEDLEILFVEGHSKDDTLAEIDKAIAAHPELDIKVVRQDGKGKADAVRKGFSRARGDILMILDADLTTPPEDLPKFYEAIASGKGELAMGSRLVYPMEDEAMQLLNTIGNKTFSLLFTWLLNQRVTDTLCGTKALSRRHYAQIVRGQEYFGDFDPFGDFDLIFGAAKLNLKILEIPVRYRARTYGVTQISRFRHAWMLLRTVLVAFRRLKAI
jgi:SAM-dependent methyltransferase